MGELTRRELIRRGALTATWATPIVTTLTMSPAHAAVPSGPPPPPPPNGGPPPNQPPPPNQQPAPEQPGAESVEVAAAQAAAVDAPSDGVEVLGLQVGQQAPLKELPFTGVEADRLSPVAAGLIAGGAAAVALAKAKESKTSQ